MRFEGSYLAVAATDTRDGGICRPGCDPAAGLPIRSPAPANDPLALCRDPERPAIRRACLGLGR